MLNKERELQELHKAFSSLRGRQVILYGTGQYTELLLQSHLEFSVIGLMDQNKTGTSYCGLPLLSEEDVRQSGCKTIILIANLSSVPAIFQRIRDFTQACGIVVYSMNGRKLAEAFPGPTQPSGGVSCEEELLIKAMQHNIISFDLFDTLIARKCLVPEEVFSVMERRAWDRDILLKDFPARRLEAEKTLYHSGQLWYHLDEIYNWLQGVYHLSAGEMDWLKDLELAVEQEVVTPREDMIRCYKALRDAGKRVVITSDMYLTTVQLAPLLKKCGIADAELYISSECQASKHIGTLFQKLREYIPNEDILHIGDNPRSDIENAQREGLSAIHIPSGRAQMSLYGLDQLEGTARNDPEKHMYELFAQKCFQNVFRKGEHGRILLDDPKEIGYLFFGPLAAGYLAWLVKQLEKKSIGHILFISRDGYIFHQLYCQLQKRCGGLPEASYFLTSRRCASNAAIMSPADVRFVFEEVCYSRDLCVKDMLEKAYGIAVDNKDPIAGYTLGELGSAVVWEHLRKEYMSRILEHAADERAAYHKYIEKLDLPDQKIGMMNFVGRGVTQRCLTKVIEKDLLGFYFAMEYDAEHILGGVRKDIAVSWYPEDFSSHTSKRKLAEQMLLGETVFSAPHGAVIAFSDEGKPLYESTTHVRGELIRACHEGIVEYFEDAVQLGNGLDGLEDTVEMADAIFGLLCDDRFMLSERIKAAFQFEDRFQ